MADEVNTVEVNPVDQLSARERAILDRLDWGICEDCKEKVMSSSTLLRQLLNGEVTDFVGHQAKEIDAETGEKIPVHSYEFGGLQIRYKSEGPIKICFRPKRERPYLKTEYGTNIMNDERRTILTDAIITELKNEDGTPKLDEYGNQLITAEYRNLNAGEPIYIENSKGEKTAYLVSLDFPEYTKEGTQYRGTNELVTKPVSIVKSHLEKFYAKGDFRGHKFTAEELQQLTVGKAILLTDLKKKDGSTYTMSVQYNVAKNKIETVRNKEYFKSLDTQRTINRFFNNKQAEAPKEAEAPKQTETAKKSSSKTKRS